MKKITTHKTFAIIVFGDENISTVHSSCAEKSESTKMFTAFWVKTDQRPQRIKINNDHKSMEAALVAEHLEYVSVFRDHVPILCNALGKLDGNRPNRALYVAGRLVDVLRGNFIIVGDDINRGDISFLTPEQFDMYEKIFYDPL